MPSGIIYVGYKLTSSNRKDATREASKEPSRKDNLEVHTVDNEWYRFQREMKINNLQ